MNWSSDHRRTALLAPARPCSPRRVRGSIGIMGYGLVRRVAKEPEINDK